MKNLLFLIVGFLYCNVTWQSIVWLYGLVPSFIGLVLVFVIPIALGVGLFLYFNAKVDENMSAIFVGAGILIPVVYMFSFATRMPDYVRYVETGRHTFVGRPADISDRSAVFYEIREFVAGKVDNGEFGVSYSVTSRKSSTTHSKHFVVPIFDAADTTSPRAFAFATYTGGSSEIDGGQRGLYGFDQTLLRQRIGRENLSGRKVSDDNAVKAVADYVQKRGANPEPAPLIIELVDESAADYFKTGAFHFWSMTAILNLIFMGVCFYASSHTAD